MGYFDGEQTDASKLLDGIDPAIEEAKAHAILAENKKEDEALKQQLRQRRREARQEQIEREESKVEPKEPVVL